MESLNLYDIEVHLCSQESSIELNKCLIPLNFERNQDANFTVLDEYDECFCSSLIIAVQRNNECMLSVCNVDICNDEPEIISEHMISLNKMSDCHLLSEDICPKDLTPFGIAYMFGFFTAYILCCILQISCICFFIEYNKSFMQTLERETVQDLVLSSV